MLKAWISFLLPVGEDPSNRREAEDGWVLFPLHAHLPPWAVTPFDLKKVNRVRPALKKN